MSDYIDQLNIYGTEIPVWDTGAREGIAKLTGNRIYGDFTKEKSIKTTAGSAVNINAPETHSGAACIAAACAKGDQFVLTGTGFAADYTLYVFTDGNGNILARSGANQSASDLLLTAPANAAWLVCNVNTSLAYSLIGSSYLRTRVDSLETLEKMQQQKKNLAAVPLSFVSGIYVGDNLETVIETPTANENYVCAMCSCAAGDVFSIKVYGANTGRAFGFLNASHELIGMAKKNMTYEGEVTAPTNAAYFYVNHSERDAPGEYYAFKGTGLPVEKEVERLRSGVGETETKLNTTTYQSSYYWNDGGRDTAEKKSKSGYLAYEYRDVTPGEKYRVSVYCADGDSQSPVVLAKRTSEIVNNEETNVVYTARRRYKNLNYGRQSFTFVIPEDTNCILVTCAASQGGSETYKLETTNVTLSAQNSFRGCRLSLLGDSYSAFQGYSTGGHKYYPTGDARSDVTSVDQMWWKILCDRMGMIPHVIGAWSGTAVTPGIRTTSSGNARTAASDPSRCQALGKVLDGDTEETPPDVILIAVGANDYSYMGGNETEFAQTATIGDWDGHTTLLAEGESVDDTLSHFDTSTFRTAYATMLARIQKKYPNAFIVCITPWFIMRRKTDLKSTYLNGSGNTLEDYADAVRDIARIMHCACIDGQNIGFNRYNYYASEYSVDDETQPTHPTVKGQKQMALALERQLMALHRLGDGA